MSLHFLGSLLVLYLSLWWNHGALMIHDPHGFVLVSVYLKNLVCISFCLYRLVLMEENLHQYQPV